MPHAYLDSICKGNRNLYVILSDAQTFFVDTIWIQTVWAKALGLFQGYKQPQTFRPVTEFEALIEKN